MDDEGRDRRRQAPQRYLERVDFQPFGAIVLMQTILRAEGLEVDPLRMALWGIPTAVTAFLIHAWNLRRLDAYILRGAGIARGAVNGAAQ